MAARSTAQFLVIPLVILLAGQLNTAVAEEKVKTPERIEGTTLVSAEQFLELVENKPDLVIIDARIEMDRKQGYIETSISLPNIDTDCSSLATHIPAKDHNVLFYCNGVKCGRSAKSAKIALGCGYKNIYWFRGGIEEWKDKKLPLVKDQ